MKKYLIFTTAALAFLVLTTGLFSCSKQDERHPIYVNTALEQYFDYQPGSYWVFYDSLNNNMDSLYVYSTDTLQPYWDGSTPNERITINMGLDSIPSNSNIDFHLSMASNITLMIVQYAGPNNSYIEIQYPTNFTNNVPFDTGKTIVSGVYYSGFYQDLFIQNEKIGNITYSDVYGIYFNLSPTLSDNFSINDTNGFLKIFLNNQYAHKQLYLVSFKVIK